MSATIKVRWQGAKAVADALRAASGRIHDMKPLLYEIKLAMQESTLENFEGEHDPDLKPWSPLSEATIYDKGSDRILFETGGLMSSITGYIRGGNGGGTVVVMTTDRKGPFHQEKSYNARTGFYNPGRPFIGIGEKDHKKIDEIVNAFIARSGI